MLNCFQLLTTICQILMVLASLFRCGSTGTDRGIALLFIVSGLIVTVMAMR